MKFLLIFFILFLTSTFTFARVVGETEITAEEGIEVYQDEKYYLLKKNVEIDSDNFNLSGDIIKIFFENDLYDITIIDAKGNVSLDSDEYNLKASGEKINFAIESEEIQIEGVNSILLTESSEMLSDGIVKVNNLSGDFYLNGKNSSLKSENIIIKGKEINGSFSSSSNKKEISFLNVRDENVAYINNGATEMYAVIIKYNKDTSLIELENNVKIISDGEIITGDHGTLDTKTNSYKIKSRNKNKVKVIISNKDE